MGDHEMRPECAAELAELRGSITALRANDVAHAKAVDKVTDSIALAQNDRREDHRTLVGKLDTFIVQQENRVTTVEGSTKSAHHRLNWIYGLFGTGVAAVIAWAIKLAAG